MRKVVINFIERVLKLKLFKDKFFFKYLKIDKKKNCDICLIVKPIIDGFFFLCYSIALSYTTLVKIRTKWFVF